LNRFEIHNGHDTALRDKTINGIYSSCFRRYEPAAARISLDSIIRFT
jgi:hypothetical protein